MKTNKFLTLVLTVIASLAIVSCVQDDDYTIPASLGSEENARLNKLLANGTEISIAEAKLMYTEGDFLEPIDENIYIKGYVSSSDKSGNFFKEFYLQDSPSNPTTAIKVIINQVDLYNQFNFGREVYVSLKDLYIGEERVGNGITAIGGGIETDRFGTTVTSIGETKATTRVLRSPVTETMMPLELAISEVNEDLVGIYVQLNDVEFADNVLGLRYFDPQEDFDTKRALQSCESVNYTTINLETSSFSNFKNELLPTGNGTLKAVVNKTFDGSSVVLALNTVEDVNLMGERCTLATPIFSEDFESGTRFDDVNLPGWTNFNVNGGSNLFVFRDFNDNMYAQISAFNSGENPLNAWLVTPGIDLSGLSSAALSFLTKDGFNNGAGLKVYVSTDFSGDPTTATWTELSEANIATGTSSGFASSFTFSGNLDLSAYLGDTVYVAFEYNGAANGITTTYQIDDVSVVAN
ncbi:DUF5689 domain-containing protein [Bizionia sediminis]|uniref:DUF5689 domain-containing protein n=1 Tax=Bizionia sediminis TaxID=1737064 RepID=A0ABW5KU23_9FLAO